MFGTDNYDIRNWYWVVAETGKVFSSAAMAYVDDTDADYVAWTDAGNTAAAIDTTESLYGAMSTLWLSTYLQAVQVASTATPALDGTYSLSQIEQNQITSISNRISAGRGLPGGGATFTYQGHDFDAATFPQFADATQDWIYNTYDALNSIIINGTGTLPTQPVQMP